MNYNKNVVVFTLVTTIILFLYSLFAAVYQPHLLALNNISIISDVIKIAGAGKADSGITSNLPIDTAMPAPQAGNFGALPPRWLGAYNLSKTITSFYSDTTLPALPAVMDKLYQIKKNGKGKVRIAWLGDSMIEGDLLTQTFRKRIQQFFGSYGVGFIPGTSVTAMYRTTVTHKWSGTWDEENFKTRDLTGPLFLSGHLFYTNDATITLKDNTVKDSAQALEKSIICGYVPNPFSITVNGAPLQINAGKRFNKIPVDSSASHTISVAFGSGKKPVYGISMEPKNGVVIDNFSFRGITGIELGKLDTNFLQSIQQEDHYDLVVLEYGANLMFRPDDSDYSWFQKHIIPVVRRLQQAMPNTEFLLISTSDRAFRYGEQWQTARGINNLIKSQAEVAYGNGAAFFNMFKSMGGAGTIVRWADSSSPSLANKDYIHPNQRGAEILGNMFFDCFMKDYNKNAVLEADKENYVTTASNTIIDKKTNLEWYISDDKDYTWPDAKEWVKNLTVGKGNWTVPTPEQVLTLYNAQARAGLGFQFKGEMYYAKISPSFKNIGHGTWVWTSEEQSPGKQYTINLNQGIKVPSAKDSVHYPIRVFAVRKINAQYN